MANYNFIGGDGKSYGPYTADQMRQFVAQNRLTAQSQVSADGGPWQPAANVPELMGGGVAGPAPPMAQPGMPQMAGAPQGYLKPHRGGTILTLGILGLVCCGPCAIAAWVMGNTDLKEIDRGAMDPSGRGSTNGGKICGIIGCVLWGLAIGLQILLAIGAGA